MTVRLTTTAKAVWRATVDWAGAPTHLGVWLGQHFLGADDFAAPDVLGEGDTYTIDAGMRYDWTVTPDGAVTGSADAALAALMDAGAGGVTMSLSLHDGDPGSNGSANELVAADNNGYARLRVAYSVSEG